MFVQSCFLLLLLGLFLWIPAFAGMKVVAADQQADKHDFSTSYDVTYDVGSDGITTVTEKIILKNLTSQYYATQFSLTIGATKVSDVAATDLAGPMSVKQDTKGTSTTLTVNFNQQVAGLNKELPWTLSFKSKDFASNQGKVWEVTLPKIISSQDLNNYNLTLAVPTSFGELTSISPTPSQTSSNGDKQFLNFTKDQLIQSGVSANFGDKQLFNFDLTYHLQNSNFVPILTNIALPPDSEYQDVFYQKLEPRPINVTVDQDGNFLAWYHLNRYEKLDVKLIGSAKLYTKSKVKNPQLDSGLTQKYLTTQKYWEVDNPTIKLKVKEVLGTNPPTSNTDKAKLIYHFVVNSLKYDSARLSGDNIDRLGAVTALSNPTAAVCMEFTDLFIAMARSAGIPARELDGYAYTSNSDLRPLSLSKDILHAWPEYWDNTKGWVMVDPTWENTTGGVDYFNKFDLNHFVFVTKGLSSEDPIPAGSYKYLGQNSKDVNVNFASDDFLGKPQLNVTIEAPSPILAGFPGVLKVKVSNFGNSLQQSSTLDINAGKLTILNGETKETGPIPAFGNSEFTYNVRTKSLIDNYDDTIMVSVAGQKYTQTVLVRPFIVFQSFPFVLVGIIGGVVLIYFGVLGGFIYRKRIMNRQIAEITQKKNTKKK